MAGIKDQMKMVRELQKAQKELKKEIIIEYIYLRRNYVQLY